MSNDARTASAVAAVRSTGPVSWPRVFAAGAGFGLLLLLLSVYPTVSHFLGGMGGSTVMRSIFADSQIPSALLLRLGAFAAVALLVHLAFGLAAAGLAWLTERARPSVSAARVGICFLWFAALLVWVFAANAAWFPRSELGSAYAGVVSLAVGRISLFDVLTAALVATVIALPGLGAWRALRLSLSRVGKRSFVAFAVLGVAVSSLVLLDRSPVAAPRNDAAPNVILVGADSLRLDELRMFGGAGDTPVLDGLLTRAHVFRDTTTPLARTFPSWVSILSGRHPRSTGAVFNLVGRDRVHVGPTLADLLRAHGYRTVFATDEVRFANIDATYGFDEVITPVIGASDFVLGSVADAPLLNLVNATSVGARLFPDTYANRAAATTYLPGRFMARLAGEIRIDGPTLLSVHFTASHWPYYWADAPEPRKSATSSKSREEYRASVRLVDAQIGEFLELLRARGALENAVVVVLSDHGEAMYLPGDSMIRDADAQTARRVTAFQWGHGTSVLSPTQYQVLMAFVGFGRSRTAIAAGASDVPASLEDIAPTILDLVDIAPGSARFDGQSLASALLGAPDPGTFLRIRFTETDFNLPRMLAGDFNVKWLAEAAVEYYRVNPASGWVEIRPDRLPQMMAYKQRAAIRGHWLMAALPTTTKETLYVLVNRETGSARVLDSRSLESGDDRAGALYDALQKRFPGELAPLATGTAASATPVTTSETTRGTT